MAAAVADYTPEHGRAATKLSKDDPALTIRLVKTPDILAELGARRSSGRPVLVGFAAETGAPEVRAREKLQTKNVDLIVANDVSRSDAGFEVTTNAVTLVSREGDEPLPLQSKAALAGVILDRVEAMLTVAQPARRDESPSTAR
jgi:phosphopantothenoylcysteine decarboxylase/phosphopantothenate--cysteine ligase